MLFQFFLSGHMFPLDILPEPWGAIVGYLPIKYLAYFPAAVLLGKVTGAKLMFDFGMLIFWVIFFFGLSRILYASGLRRYSGYGG